MIHFAVGLLYSWEIEYILSKSYGLCLLPSIVHIVKKIEIHFKLSSFYAYLWTFQTISKISS